MKLKALFVVLPGIALNLAAPHVLADTGSGTLFTDEQNEASYIVPAREAVSAARTAVSSHQASLFTDEQYEAAYGHGNFEAVSLSPGSTLAYETDLFVDEKEEMTYL